MTHRLRWLLAVLALLAAACSSSSDTDTTADAETSSTTTTTVAETTTTTTSVPSDETQLAFDGDSISIFDLEAMLVDAPPGATVADIASSWLIARAALGQATAAGYEATEDDRAESVGFVTAQGIDPESEWGQITVDLDLAGLLLNRLADEAAAADTDPAAAPEAMCSSHILVETEEEAAAASERANAGEDFAELARELSTGPSGPNGGQLGCSLTSAYVPEFSAGARGNGVGITGPVESQFGWHVIEVRSIGPATVDVHPELTEAEAAQFAAQAGPGRAGEIWQEQLAAIYDRIGNEADIPAELGQWDPIAGRILG